MPIYYEKKPCTQADGDKGNYTLYEKKPGKDKKVGCSTSKEKAKAYLRGSRADWKWAKTSKKNESIVIENVLQRLLEYISCHEDVDTIESEEDEDML